MSDTLVSTLHAFKPHFIITEGRYYYPHFKDEDKDEEKLSNLPKKQRMAICNLALEPVVLTIMLKSMSSRKIEFKIKEWNI